ncbi:glucose-1-phosphate adenylyltransferase [Halanaerocella petrolearia]
MKTLALILAGGRGTRLDILSNHRAKPGMPFAGKFRLIDFALSNCINSGIYNVGVLTQYLPMSLHKHIGIGKPWDLDRRIGGVTLLQPYTGNNKGGSWYQGTAHAVYQNIDYIKQNNPEYVIILSGDHVYKMDYSKMVRDHKTNGADLTIAAQRVPYKEANRFGILECNQDAKITNFAEKPDKPTSNLASMGIYVFNTETLLDILEECCTQESSDFGHHIIPPMIENNRVFAYEFDGYWKDVGTLECFWETNLSLTDPVPEFNLYDQNWKIHTRSEERPPVKFGDRGRVVGSIVANGSIINGEVENSVISPGVFIEEGAVVRDSIIFNNTLVKQDSIISKSIIDKEVIIGSNCHIGFGNNLVPNRECPNLLDCGLTVIAKGAHIPNNTQIGRDCRVFSYVDQNDFVNKVISSGNTVRPKEDTEEVYLLGTAE